MRIIIILSLMILLSSCSKEQGEDYPTVTYELDGIGSAAEIQITINQIALNCPECTATKHFENETLPFSFTINEFHPHQMQLFVGMSMDETNNKLSKISFFKNGELVAFDDTLDDPYYFANDPYTHYKLILRW